MMEATARIGSFNNDVAVLPRRDRDPATRLGDYTVLAQLSRGGMCRVYLAEHVMTGERVALKILDPQFARSQDIVDQLFAEREVSERVRHPGLLDVRAAHSVGDLPYVVMEYLDGENLGELAEKGELEFGAIAAVGSQIAAAIAALHSANVIHCDIKPSNVFVLYQQGPGGWPRVKVIDYGIARCLDAPKLEEGTIAGTPSYMAPEQWHGTVSVKTDVYSLGCLLYELAIGAPPFTGPLPMLMVAHAEQRPERPSWLRKNMPVELERAILGALAKDPAMRPTMLDLAHTLAAIADATLRAEAERAIA